MVKRVVSMLVFVMVVLISPVASAGWLALFGASFAAIVACEG